MLDVESRIVIGMRAVATDHAAKRLLIGPAGSVYIMAHAALLRRIGALDSDYETRCMGRGNWEFRCSLRQFKHTNSSCGKYRSMLSVVV